MVNRDTVRSYLEGVRQQYKFVKETQPDVIDGKPTEQDCFNNTVANMLHAIMESLEMLERAAFGDAEDLRQ